MDDKESEDCIMLLREWLVFCEQQSRLHDSSRAYYKGINYKMAIPAILLSTIGGTANIGVSGDDMCKGKNEESHINNYRRWLPVLFGSLGLLSATLFTIHRYMSIPELQKEHDFYSDEYAKLCNEIKMNLFIGTSPHKTYTNLTEFTKQCKRTLDILVDKEPPVPSFIRKRLYPTATEQSSSKEGFLQRRSQKQKRPTTNIPSLTFFNTMGTSHGLYSPRSLTTKDQPQLQIQQQPSDREELDHTSFETASMGDGGSVILELRKTNPPKI